MTQTVKARGIPQHVIDKLDFPVLPDGYYWQVWKPYREKYDRYDTPTMMSMWVEIRRDRRFSWLAPDTVLAAVPEDGTGWVWDPTSTTLVDAFNRVAEKAHKVFVEKYAAQIQIDELWRKP